MTHVGVCIWTKLLRFGSINIGMLTEVGSGIKVTDYSSIYKCRMQIYLIIHYTSDQ